MITKIIVTRAKHHFKRYKFDQLTDTFKFTVTD